MSSTTDMSTDTGSVLEKTRDDRSADDVVLRLEDLVVEFPAGAGQVVHAVSGINLEVRRGETLGLVGESGCGKSTTGRAIMQLPRPTGGSVHFDGRDLAALSPEEVRKLRPKLQMIFQDPISSLNPRRRIPDIVGDPLVVWGRGADKDKVVPDVLRAVGLDPDQVADRRPHQFSGGQCQRVSIARALVLEPEVLICDEPVSALDVSVQAQILNLLEDMKARYGLTLVFIAHDLGVVRNISDRVAVMYLGRICELGPTEALFDAPVHPYTRLLVSSIPSMEGAQRGEVGTGEMPSPVSPPSGCRFRTRCPLATDRCADEVPQMREVAPGRFTACHHPVLDTAVGEPIAPAVTAVPTTPLTASNGAGSNGAGSNGAASSRTES
ncbi:MULTISPECIES: ABC transporter ATP-binding protein [Pseudonocardia]|jgi:peptide/nickel transport system ATP-binding protein|uniref:Oligopeptide/dipeptide ABC transporter, ATPase subunit n=1 Tax=Pseudonocardia dioxanivorans (strain ATCC 55486 / DSM 44775 / JCM 13855 / CB1190) TaxID=675635 RepID=F4CJK2_PSEUX|nr:ABC transporter ATP-binding protein [Pseudonocardia dioxanivorans]AEA25862.1 oligopeptide/dipeptide ABC transporter, ATPase subunit [Pseudonocardia dioxanivorans CB1190]GJF06378.1 ABC transporter ATP-binding protein [Pseudonocardia sp. D17]